MELELPFPPDRDQYFSGEGDEARVTRDGRRYRHEVARVVGLAGTTPIDGPVGLHVVFHPPNEECDILDPIGPLIDGLEVGGVLGDDAQIVLLYAEWANQVDGGKAEVELWQVQA